MKILLFLLSIGVFTTCGAKDLPAAKEKVMQQQNIIKLVNSNDIEGVKKALRNGADVNTQDKNNRNLLLLATINKQDTMAKLLVEKGADVNMQTNNQDSPFLYAGASGQTELVRLFLAHGARFDLFNRYNGSALIPACERGHVETVRLLVNTKGYPIDHVNRLGWTALMEAIVLGNGTKKYQGIVQILKDGGANLQIPDHDGITPIQHAKNRGFNEIVKILSK
ncbi:ankyrin repeat domain-containing protein [Sphingobacterium sp. SRCM116780]|uniref:ankyrin repeat domain-containing protein n=1 Tax=Sphingobacterium sp. SRCM116780 TaxID=2907623 RepID=UPI001F273211|nr:ankyrin repeat domain-containing protein [Sphingobacterium sp. SRCM116780]UIR57677.1 ankyrin repeat domain-containing protein [Sphingobacterium sp. SRCM116780]